MDMLDDIETRSLDQLGEILETLHEEEVRDEVDRNRLVLALARLDSRKSVRALQIHRVRDELTRRNPGV